MPVNPLTAIGIGAGIVGQIGKWIGRGAANRRLNNLLKSDPTYSENPLAKQRLGLANTLLNARMPSAATEERNIYGNTANAVSNAERAATSSNELLLAGTGIQGQANKAFENLGTEENQDYQRRYGNEVSAQEGVINEQDKVFNDNVRRFQDKVQIQGAQSNNNTSGWQDFSNLGFGLADLGVNGGFTPKPKPTVQPLRF